MTLTVFRRTSQVFYRMSLNCDWSDVFLMSRLKVKCFGEDHRSKVSFLSHHIKGIYYQHDWSLLMLTLITWLVVIFVRFLHCRVTLFFFFFPSFPYCNLWKKFTSPHSRNGELYLTSLRVECQIFSFSSIYLFNHLFVLAWTDGYLFLLWVIIRYYFIYFVAPFFYSNKLNKYLAA